MGSGAVATVDRNNINALFGKFLQGSLDRVDGWRDVMTNITVGCNCRLYISQRGTVATAVRVGDQADMRVVDGDVSAIQGCLSVWMGYYSLTGILTQ